MSRPTFTGGSRTTDDVVVRSGDMYLSTTDAGTRIITPSRNSSLRRTASMTDLEDIVTASSDGQSQSPQTIPSFLSSPRPLPTGPRAAPTPSSSASSSKRTYGTARSSPPPTTFHSSKSSLAPPGTSYVTASTRTPSSTASAPSQRPPRGMFYTPGDHGPSRRLLLSPTKTVSEYSLTSLNEQEKHRLFAADNRSEVGSVSDMGSLMSPVSETQSLSGTGTEQRSIPLSFHQGVSSSMLGDSHAGPISETRAETGSGTPTEFLTPPPSSTPRRGRRHPTEPSSSSSSSPSPSSTPTGTSRSSTERSPGSVERRPRVQTRRPPSSKETSPARESVSYRTAGDEPEKENEPNTPTTSTFSLLRSPDHTPTGSYRTASSDASPVALRQESIRTGSFKTTSEPEGSERASSAGSVETKQTQGDRPQLRRPDSYFTERSANGSSVPSTYTMEEDLCLFTDHSDDYRIDLSWSRGQTERSRSITPTPSTKYTTASEPRRSPALTTYSTASLPSTIPTIKSESLYGTAEVPPTSTRFSTAEPYSSSTGTPIPSRVPSRLSVPTTSSPLGTPTPSQVGTIPDLVSEDRVSTTRTSPSPSSVGSVTPTPTMSRTMSIAGRTRSRRSLLSAASQPSPPRTVSLGGTSYAPATTLSVSPSSVSSITASSFIPPPSPSDPGSSPSDSTPTPVPSTSYVFSTPSSGSFIMPPAPPPSSTIALSPPAPSSRTAGSARASTQLSDLLSSSLLDRTQSIASSVPRPSEGSFESSVLNQTISAPSTITRSDAGRPSPYLSVPSARMSSTPSRASASSLGSLVRRLSTRSIDSTVLLPSRASSLRSTTTQRESASTYL